MRARRAAELEVARALESADHRYGPSVPYRYDSVYVTKAAPRRPYGRSTHSSSYLTHLVAGLYVAWRHGTHVGSRVKWRCGGSSRTFRLLDEPDSVICPACTIERPARPRRPR